MEFFDCNTFYGYNISSGSTESFTTIGALKNALLSEGVKKAMTWRWEQYFGDPATGNEMLADDIRNEEMFYGIWSIVPSHTGEMQSPETIVKIMRENRIFAWQIFPAKHRFLPLYFVLRDWINTAVIYNIPLFVKTEFGTTLEHLAMLLEREPGLTVVLTHNNIWPDDRLLRPFKKEFPNVYLDLSFCITAGGIENFVKQYGADRLLYGSNFPGSYMGAGKLMVKHAGISEQDKEKIACGNLEENYRDGENLKQYTRLIDDFINKGFSKDCPIIDFHAHMGNFSGAYMPAGAPRDMLHEMDRCNVVLTHFCSHHALTMPGKAESYDLKVAREYSDRFKAYYPVISRFLNPEKDLEIVEKNRDIVAGFKFHCEWYGVPIYHPDHTPYFEYADSNKLLVLSHTWGENELDGVKAVSKVLEKYCNLIFIAGHSFHGDWDGAVSLLKDYPNLYLELTAVLAERGHLEYIVSKVGSKRVLFGVDMPWFSYYHGIGALCSADITDEDRHNILHRNGEALLGLNLY